MKKIACVVVTYNRLQLLKRCIESIKKQSFEDFDIFVINNGSTDGTLEWLSSQEGITVVNQENVGGAGGFYTGMSTSYKKGYEWIWMMDDDGVTDENQLQCLYEMSVANGFVYANALVCNIDTPSILSFGLSNNGVPILYSEEAKNTMYINSINPFNGTFIHRSVMDKIGFIKKEMFIWGDEEEYTLRAKRSGINPVTITTAIHYHPSIKTTKVNVFPCFKKIKVSLKPTNLSKYYYRNLGYIYKTYHSDRVWRPLFAYSTYFILRGKLFEFFKFIRFYNKGIRNDYK